LCIDQSICLRHIPNTGTDMSTGNVVRFKSLLLSEMLFGLFYFLLGELPHYTLSAIRYYEKESINGRIG